VKSPEKSGLMQMRLTSWTRTVSSLLVILFCTAAPAREERESRGPKKAWEWSEDERLSERLNPASIRDRSAKEATEPYGARLPALSGHGAGVNAVSEFGTVIVGRRNPELFMPFELFSHLISECFDDDSSVRIRARSRLAPFLIDVTPPGRFWSALESSASEFIANQRAQRHLLESMNTAKTTDERTAMRQQLKNLQQPECALRAVALKSVTAAIGHEKLYKILYEGVAPEINMFSQEPENAECLRSVERGCQ